jgi:undecaprenyl diphosphate synthase
MDGNGRWAQQQGLSRSKGHEEGANTIRAITTHAVGLGVSHLTLYAFSTENWNRPKLEVDFLMKLMIKYLKNELPLFIENNIRFETIGDLSRFSPSLQKQIQHTKEKTAHATGLTQILALNYGAHDEIARACEKVSQKGLSFTPDVITQHLDTSSFPVIDIMIRTGGEIRLSNFLLWQLAYAELFFTPTLWPEFTTRELSEIILSFKKRERRFGMVK